jgi:hypothetical protein
MAAKLPNLRLVQAARAAEILLLASGVILHAAGLFSAAQLKSLGTAGNLLAEALPFASLALLSLWIPLGPGPLWMRAAASPLLAWLIYQAANSHGPTDWTIADKLLASVGAGLAVVAVMLRLCGVRALPTSPRLDAKATQFSVRGLLIVTTLVALCFGGLEAARPWLVLTDARPIVNDAGLGAMLNGTSTKEYLDINWAAYSYWLEDVRPRHALMTVVLVGASLLAAWAVLRPGVIWLRSLGVAISLTSAGLYLGQLTRFDTESTLTMTVWIATIGLIVGLSVVPLRLMGYRVVRPCIAATSGRAERTPTHGSAGASPSQSSPSEHVLAESHS